MKREMVNLTLSVHEDSDLVTLPYAQQTRFVVSMVTTFRHGLFLEANFGDGHSRTINLEEGSTANKNKSEQGISMLMSYGVGCQLVINIEHEYDMQGAFKPNVRLHDNSTSKTTELSDKIIVLNELKQATVLGVSTSALAVGRVANLSVSFKVSSINVTYYWSIEDTEHTVSENYTKNGNTLNHRFDKPGSYTIHMKAENLVSLVEACKHIEVQYAVAELTLSTGQEPFVKTGEFISFVATIGSGTDVDFDWDVSDAHGNTYLGFVKYENKSLSYVNHSFANPGEYNISVRAWNLIGQLNYFYPETVIVEDPVQGLDLTFASPILLGNHTEIIATVTAGTMVKFAVDFGSGKEVVESKGIYHAYITKEMVKVGRHNVKVYAYNNVSEESETIMIEVQADIPDVSVTTSIKPVRREPINFVARLRSTYIFNSYALRSSYLISMGRESKLPTPTHQYFASVSGYIYSLLPMQMQNYIVSGVIHLLPIFKSNHPPLLPIFWGIIIHLPHILGQSYTSPIFLGNHTPPIYWGNHPPPHILG